MYVCMHMYTYINECIYVYDYIHVCYLFSWLLVFGLHSLGANMVWEGFHIVWEGCISLGIWIQGDSVRLSQILGPSLQRSRSAT